MPDPPNPACAATPGAGDAVAPSRTGDDSARPHGWVIEATTGSAQWFHDRDPTADAGHRVWIHHLSTEAIVLGSAQSPDVIRADEAERRGVEVCRRRSGGGLVHIQPESDLWIDIVLPRHSPLWDDDVGRSFHWLGRHWAHVLERHFSGRGVDLDWTVATGAVRQPEGRLLCFADVGHGEVLCCDRKVVGLSQRRTRHWARLQALLVARGRHQALLSILDAGSALAVVAGTGAGPGPNRGGSDRREAGNESGPIRLEGLAAVLRSVDHMIGLPDGCPPPNRAGLIDDFCRSLPAV